MLALAVDRELHAVAVDRRHRPFVVGGDAEVSVAVHGRRVPTPGGSGLYPALVKRFRRHEFEVEEGLRPARFGVSLILIIASIFAIAFSGDSDWARVLALVLQGAALLYILWTSDAHKRFLQIARNVVVISVFAASLVAIFGTDKTPAAATAIVGALMAVGGPIAIVRRLAREKVIDLEVLMGAMCLYLLIGLFFTFVYSLIQVTQTEPIFVQLSDKATSANITYFSYVTMTTVGYGDLTLGEDIPRMIAVTEALIGQLYLVSAVALVVGRLGQERAAPMRRGGGDTTDGP